jgi:hypothetical protein
MIEVHPFGQPPGNPDERPLLGRCRKLVWERSAVLKAVAGVVIGKVDAAAPNEVTLIHSSAL